MIQHASIDDSTLFERITRHDAEAFGIVMRRYAGALYAFAFRIVGDTLAAEDIVQEVFINLWEKRRKLSPGPSLRNFLYLAFGCRKTILPKPMLICLNKRQGFG